MSRAICTGAKAPVTFARGRGAIKETGGSDRWCWRSLVRNGGHQDCQLAAATPGKQELGISIVTHLRSFTEHTYTHTLTHLKYNRKFGGACSRW